MSLCPSLTRIIPLVLIVSLLCSCVFPQHYADGVVIGAEKIPNSFSLKQRVIKDTQTFGTTGAIVGGIVGGTVFSLIGFAMIPGDLPAIALVGLMGGGAGALSLGLLGVATGAGIGVSRGYINSHAVQYEYAVKTLDKGMFTIKQYATPIAVNTKVKILRQNDRLFIRKK